MSSLHLAIIGGKGGVGKSTICSNLGYSLSKSGKNTLIIDGDLDSPSIGLIFGLNQKVPTVHDYLSERSDPDSIIQDTFDNLDIISGGISLNSLKDIKLEKFDTLISEFSDDYDLILLDSPPGLSETFNTVFSGGDVAIIVVNPDLISITGSLRLKELANRKGIRILGVIVNRLRNNSAISGELIQEMTELDVIGVIEEDANVLKSLNKGSPTNRENPNTIFSKRINEIVEKLIT